MSGASGGVTGQLPALVFYLGWGAVVLLIVVILDVLGEHVDRKRRRQREAEIRRAHRAQVWAELEGPELW